MNAITSAATGFDNISLRHASPARRLREIARACETQEPLDTENALWLAGVLNAYLDRGAGSLDEVLGLRQGRGGISWRQAETMRLRDTALRMLAQRFFARLSPCARSREIEQLAARYDTTAWQIDREKADMPPHYAGTPKEFLWIAFQSGATMPLGERQIRNIVG